MLLEVCPGLNNEKKQNQMLETGFLLILDSTNRANIIHSTSPKRTGKKLCWCARDTNDYN